MIDPDADDADGRPQDAAQDDRTQRLLIGEHAAGRVGGPAGDEECVSPQPQRLSERLFARKSPREQGRGFLRRNPPEGGVQNAAEAPGRRRKSDALGIPKPAVRRLPRLFVLRAQPTTCPASAASPTPKTAAPVSRGAVEGSVQALREAISAAPTAIALCTTASPTR